MARHRRAIFIVVMYVPRRRGWFAEPGVETRVVHTRFNQSANKQITTSANYLTPISFKRSFTNCPSSETYAGEKLNCIPAASYSCGSVLV